MFKKKFKNMSNSKKPIIEKPLPTIPPLPKRPIEVEPKLPGRGLPIKMPKEKPIKEEPIRREDIPIKDNSFIMGEDMEVARGIVEEDVSLKDDSSLEEDVINKNMKAINRIAAIMSI